MTTATTTTKAATKAASAIITTCADALVGFAEMSPRPTAQEPQEDLDEGEAQALRRAGWQLLHKVDALYQVYGADLSTAQEEALWRAINDLEDGLTTVPYARPLQGRAATWDRNPAVYQQALRDLRAAMERLAPLDVLTVTRQATRQ